MRPSPRAALALMVGLAVIAAAELGAAAFAYRDTIAPAHWAAVEAGLDPELPVLVGTPWLDPVARAALPAVATEQALAPPDLRGLPTFQALSYRGDEARIAALAALAPDLPTPVVRERQRFGPLRLTTYDQPGAHPPRDTLAARWKSRGPLAPEVSMEGRRCAASDGVYRCREGGRERGRVELRLAEIDGRVHHCLHTQLDDGVALRVTVPGFEFGGELHGHLGFPGFNARLRSEAPVTVGIGQGDAPPRWWTFTDAQGWAPLHASTQPGTAPLVVEVQGAVGGTWNDTGYRPSPQRPVCLELRAFDGPEAAAGGAP